MDEYEMRKKWAVYKERLESGHDVDGSLFGASYIIARSGVTDVNACLDEIERLNTVLDAVRWDKS